MSTPDEHLQKWRLILGAKADPDGEVEMGEKLQGMSNTLDALYDSEKKGGLGNSVPNVNRWLGDIRRYFPRSVVQIMQRDALERLGLNRMLLEPELLAAVEPDVHLVGTLLSLAKILPDRSRETARQLVRQVTQELEKRLRQPLLQAIRGSLHRAARTRRPRPGDIDWRQTILKNLKHYQPKYKSIIPAELRGYARRQQQLRHLILLIDQSGSMAESVVHAGVLSCIMASLRSIQTQVIAFDTNVVDLTEHLTDPVDLLFATQLGGGTDINRALTYVEPLVSRPRDTIIVLLSDLFEGGNISEMFRRIARLQATGLQFICLLALSDEGAGAYDHGHAQQLGQMGIPTFAATPDQFPEIMAAAIQRESLGRFLK
ncbi:VWA domain-containing protein [Lewinella sp. LCG006]|uniref:VWA domain-containing protein n=1 Tax=Lewinella sp. LCG006 TaxID=3231911 RepID=UPI00346092E2